MGEMEEMDEAVISIDAEFQLRILNPDVHERSTRLVADCELFVSSTYSLHYAVHSYGKFPSLNSLTTIPPSLPLSLSAMPNVAPPPCYLYATRTRETKRLESSKPS
jgi:hypothetical protein